MVKLAELARPFVDKEPVDVIRRLIEERSVEEISETEPTYSPLAPPDLSHTKILAATIDGEPIAKANWNRLMDYAINLAAQELNDVNALSKLVLAKHSKRRRSRRDFTICPKLKSRCKGRPRIAPGKRRLTFSSNWATRQW